MRSLLEKHSCKNKGKATGIVSKRTIMFCSFLWTTAMDSMWRSNRIQQELTQPSVISTAWRILRYFLNVRLPKPISIQGEACRDGDWHLMAAPAEALGEVCGGCSLLVQEQELSKQALQLQRDYPNLETATREHSQHVRQSLPTRHFKNRSNFLHRREATPSLPPSKP